VPSFKGFIVGLHFAVDYSLLFVIGKAFFSSLAPPKFKLSFGIDILEGLIKA